jgi:hypothetical protein
VHLVTVGEPTPFVVGGNCQLGPLRPGPGGGGGAGH